MSSVLSTRANIEDGCRLTLLYHPVAVRAAPCPNAGLLAGPNAPRDIGKLVVLLDVFRTTGVRVEFATSSGSSSST